MFLLMQSILQCRRCFYSLLTLGILETPKWVLWQTVNTFHQGLHCLLRLKLPLGTEIYIRHNFENSTCEPLKYKVGSPMLIVSICMGKSIRIQRVNMDSLCG